MARRDFRPVLLGTDLGVYSIARSFHEAYGLGSIVVSNQMRGPIANSAIIDNVLAGPGASDEQVSTTLEQVAADHPGKRLLLIVNAEHEVEFVQRHRQRLEEHFDIPMPGNDVLRDAADKNVLHETCHALGLPVPPAIGVNLAEAEEPDWQPPSLTLRFPVVIKAARSAEHLLASFPGKKKVYPANDAAEADEVLRLLAAAGLRDEVLVQEMVPGDDTWIRTVTCYVDSRGRVTMMASGQLLLGLHSPNMVGNAATILTTPQPELEKQAAAILNHLGYTGYANFDIKIDPRDDTPYFLDLNPRIGRPNYYVNVAGLNPAHAVVADYLDSHEVASPTVAPQRVGIYSYVPYCLVRRYIRDTRLRSQVARLHRSQRFSHPLAYPLDRTPRRWAYRMASTINLLRDFRAHYPRATDIGW